MSLDGADVGYGAIKGFAEIAHRDALFELYVDPAARPRAVPLARAVLAAAGADHLQCQTNDAPYHDVFRQLATDVEVEAILFADDRQTDLAVPGAIARRRRDDDAIFEHTAEPASRIWASQATLGRAGLRPCGFVLAAKAAIDSPESPPSARFSSRFWPAG